MRGTGTFLTLDCLDFLPLNWTHNQNITILRHYSFNLNSLTGSACLLLCMHARTAHIASTIHPMDSNFFLSPFSHDLSIPLTLSLNCAFYYVTTWPLSPSCSIAHALRTSFCMHSQSLFTYSSTQYYGKANSSNPYPSRTPSRPHIMKVFSLSKIPSGTSGYELYEL